MENKSGVSAGGSGKNNKIIKVAEDRGLLDGVVGILQYVREALCEIMFELFVRSGNVAVGNKG